MGCLKYAPFSAEKAEGEREYLTYTLLPRLEVGNKLGNKLTGLERLQVTGLLWLIIDNNCPETSSLTN